MRKLDYSTGAGIDLMNPPQASSGLSSPSRESPMSSSWAGGRVGDGGLDGKVFCSLRATGKCCWLRDGTGSPYSAPPAKGFCSGEVTRDSTGGGLCTGCSHKDVLNTGHVLLGPGDYVGVAIG